MDTRKALSQLGIHLLGPPRLLIDERPLQLRRRKAVALVAYLAVTRRSYSREALTALLWPDTHRARAHANLRNILWILKQSGFGPWLTADQESVAIDLAAGGRCDVTEFEERLADCRLQRGHGAELTSRDQTELTVATALYQDHFMAGFSLGDNLEYDEWQTQQDESLRARLAAALALLADHHAARGEFTQAIAAVRRWLSLDPFNEPVQRRLMMLYVRAGRRIAALELYASGARLLEKELGLSPTTETVELRNRILSGELDTGGDGTPASSVAIDAAAAGRHATEPGTGVAPAAARATTPPRHDLPAPTTPFIDRDVELEEIERLLAGPDCRLLTVVGTGGSGKTRLALEAATGLADRFRDGVAFVPLAPLVEPRLLTTTIADRLHVPGTSSHAAPDHPGSAAHAGAAAVRDSSLAAATNRRRRDLLDYLRGKHLLVVLDNLEQLHEGLELLTEILQAAPEVRILATSRRRLHLPGETALELEGLPFPASDDLVDLAGVTDDRFGAVRLFVQTAERARVGFSPGSDDRQAIARVCSHVRGNPLAIELAAAWVKVLDCTQIAGEVATTLDFLVDPDGRPTDRHRSLRTVFEQSWQLLTPAERACFQRLCVLRGRFSRPAAQAIGDASLNTLAGLIDKSLMRRHQDGGFEIHELLRQFGEELLRQNEAQHAGTLEALTDHYLRRLVERERSFKGHDVKEALAELTAESDNVRIAWLHAARSGRVTAMVEAFVAFFLFHDIPSRFAEGAAWCREARDRLTAPPHDATPAERDRQRLLALLDIGLGWFVRFAAPADSVALARRGLLRLEPLGRDVHLAFGRTLATIIGVWSASDATWSTDVDARIEDCLTIFSEAGDRWGQALVHEVIAFRDWQREPQGALRHAQQSLRLRRRIGDAWGESLSSYTLGFLARQQGFLRTARKHYRESLALRRQLEADHAGIISCLHAMGRVSRSIMRHAEAQRLHEECLELSRDTGNRWETATNLVHLGQVAYDTGRLEEARQRLEEALPIVESFGDVAWAKMLLAMLANVALAAGDREEAKFLIDQAQARDEGDATAELTRHFREVVRGVRESDPWQPLARGKIASRGGDTRRATRELTAALTAALDNRDEPTALEALIELAEVRVERESKGEGKRDGRRAAGVPGDPHPVAGLLCYVIAHPAITPWRRDAAARLLETVGAQQPASVPDGVGDELRGRELADVAAEWLDGDANGPGNATRSAP
jgi:DNA-binding SARP family transcriptional activator/predicted ATPase